MKTPTVYLEWPARCDLGAMPWSERELGGILMGVISDGKVIVKQVVTNPNGAQERDSTGIEFESVFDIETSPTSDNYRGPGAPPLRIVGSIHSHPTVGPPQPSQPDMDHVRQGSLLKGQDHKTFASLIVAPRSELWQDGYPTGELDWEDPHVRALVAVDGEVAETVVTEEPKWMWAMRVEREMWSGTQTS